MEERMSKTTTNLSEILFALKDCVKDGDTVAAQFLRESLRDSIAESGTWLTSEEENFLDSF